MLCCGLLAVGLIGAARAAERSVLHVESTPAQTALVELFTSEGCSSCPPAERRLSALRDDPGLWRDFVPLAFHVNYWDRLGWRDRFASRESTAREYAYAAVWRSESVYTPCFVRDGREARGASLTTLVRPGAAVGVLRATYDGAVVRAAFAPSKDAGVAASAGDFVLHAAILGGGIVSAVNAGENRGATLAHEFVVLRLAESALAQALPLVVPAVDGVRRHALAIWITRRGDLTPVQATGGWLD